MEIVLTGASGFIGSRLRQKLTERGHSVRALSLRQGAPAADALRGADAVIHLAGEPVAQRWNDAVKRKIRDSRVTGTRNLVAAMAAMITAGERKPAALICASATGYYGSRGDEELTERSTAGSDFLAETCVEWEREAFAAERLGVRVAAIRTGMALHPSGGAMGKLLTPFRLGVGGRLGDGKQWTPWIHLDDLVNLYVFALEHPVRGALNGAAPNPVTNAKFTRALAAAVHRPAIFPVPAFGLRLIYGEMAGILFDSQRVLPKESENAGFRFAFPQLPGALADLLK